MLGQPVLNVGLLVRGLVVQHKVQVQVMGGPIYPAQEGPTFRRAGPLAASGEDGSGWPIKGGPPRGAAG